MTPSEDPQALEASECNALLRSKLVDRAGLAAEGSDVSMPRRSGGLESAGASMVQVGSAAWDGTGGADSRPIRAF